MPSIIQGSSWASWQPWNRDCHITASARRVGIFARAILQRSRSSLQRGGTRFSRDRFFIAKVKAHAHALDKFRGPSDLLLVWLKEFRELESAPRLARVLTRQSVLVRMFSIFFAHTLREVTIFFTSLMVLFLPRNASVIAFIHLELSGFFRVY